jgi:hypothetical protein
MGLVSKGISQLESAGIISDKFFFACIAFELYDGSYVLHSNPILMCPANDVKNRYSGLSIGSGVFDYISNKAVYSEFTGHVAENTENKYYQMINYPSGCEVGSGGADEITFDSMITSLGYSYFNSPNGEIRGIVYGNRLKYKINTSISEQYRSLIKSVSIFITPGVSGYDYTSVETKNHSFTTKVVNNFIPKPRTNEQIIELLKQNQQFYKVKEIPFDDINTNVDTWIDLTDDLKGKLGDNLINQIELPVDNFTHHTLLPQKQIVYNSKLHALDYKTILSRGWPVNYFKTNLMHSTMASKPLNLVTEACNSVTKPSLR